MNGLEIKIWNWKYLEVRAFYSGLSTLLSKCKEDLQDLILGFEIKFIQLVSTFVLIKS